MTTKHKLLVASYYLGPLGLLVFIKPSDKFERFHAAQGLSLFYFFVLMVILLGFCLWIVPILGILAAIGILAVFFFLGFGSYSVFSEQKMRLPGLKFLSRKIKAISFEEI